MAVLSTLIDPRELSGEELDQLRIEVQVEQERRESLASIPAEVADLAAKFKAGGGDVDKLADAINSPADEEA